MTGVILLAAGASKRMGTQKLLLPWQETTVVGHIVDQFLHSRADHISVITGHDRTALHRALDGCPVCLVHNPDVSHGMLSSVRCGLRALPEHCDTVLVALGDQPHITSTLIDELIQAFTRSHRRILVPCYAGRRGHPLLFARRYAGEVATRFDGVGLRGLLQAHPEEVYEYPVSQASVLSDMDVPEDYRRERDTL
jgi:molybdenum cofactor cytidylyltransferase